MVYSRLYYTADADVTGHIRDGVAVSGTDTYYSIKFRSDDGQSLDCRADGTMTGAWTLWYSGKPNPNEANDDDWHEDSGFTPTDPAGADAKFVDETSNSKVQWKRLKYVNAAGSGTIYAYMTRPSSV